MSELYAGSGDAATRCVLAERQVSELSAGSGDAATRCVLAERLVVC